jgi:hypothetical protein
VKYQDRHNEAVKNWDAAGILNLLDYGSLRFFGLPKDAPVNALRAFCWEHG